MQKETRERIVLTQRPPAIKLAVPQKYHGIPSLGKNKSAVN